jgi:hypothetical protein
MRGRSKACRVSMMEQILKQCDWSFRNGLLSVPLTPG